MRFFFSTWCTVSLTKLAFHPEQSSEPRLSPIDHFTVNMKTRQNLKPFGNLARRVLTKLQYFYRPLITLEFMAIPQGSNQVTARVSKNPPGTLAPHGGCSEN